MREIHEPFDLPQPSVNFSDIIGIAKLLAEKDFDIYRLRDELSALRSADRLPVTDGLYVDVPAGDPNCTLRLPVKGMASFRLTDAEREAVEIVALSGLAGAKELEALRRLLERTK